MFRPRRRRFKGMTINTLIPNIMTLLATCAGLTAIRWGLQDKWEHALLAILVAAILDGLDGRIARLLKGTSKFGAELDSLSDFVSFGVSPAILLYLWVMEDAGRFGWAVTLLLALACGLRLARFNATLDEPEMPAWASKFFTGVPAPAGAGLALLPMMLCEQFGDGFFDDPWLVGAWMVAVAFLMVSRIPTFSFKKVRVPQRQVMLTMLTVGVVAAAMINAPWLTLSLVLLAYLSSIPFAIRSFAILKAEAEAIHASAAEPPAEGA